MGSAGSSPASWASPGHTPNTVHPPYISPLQQATAASPMMGFQQKHLAPHPGLNQSFSPRSNLPTVSPVQRLNRSFSPSTATTNPILELQEATKKLQNNTARPDSPSDQFIRDILQNPASNSSSSQKGTVHHRPPLQSGHAPLHVRNNQVKNVNQIPSVHFGNNSLSNVPVPSNAAMLSEQKIQRLPNDFAKKNPMQNLSRQPSSFSNNVPRKHVPVVNPHRLQNMPAVPSINNSLLPIVPDLHNSNLTQNVPNRTVHNGMPVVPHMQPNRPPMRNINQFTNIGRPQMRPCPPRVSHPSRPRLPSSVPPNQLRYRGPHPPELSRPSFPPVLQRKPSMKTTSVSRHNGGQDDVIKVSPFYCSLLFIVFDKFSFCYLYQCCKYAFMTRGS